MDEAERRIQMIKDLAGEEALKVLAHAGMDVEEVLDRHIREEVQRDRELDFTTALPTPDNSMTSELVYRSGKPEDVFGREYVRRLKLLGFGDDQIKSLYQIERDTVALRKFPERDSAWVRRYFFIDTATTAENLPRPDELTLSELILITDDATSAYVRVHEWLSPETWSAVCKAAIQAHSFGGAQYAIALSERAKSLGWTGPQEGAYTRNESLLTERFKWSMHENPAWMPETTDLKQYQR